MEVLKMEAKGQTPKKALWMLPIAFFVFFMATCRAPADKSTSPTESRLKFDISFPKEIHSDDITGRAYVIISRSPEPEPRLQAVRAVGVPFFGKNIEALKPDQAAIIDGAVFGHPLQSIKDIPPGEYYVQGFINIYTMFKRSDGHALWLHDDQWEGQHWNISPGNIYSDVFKVVLDPSKKNTVKLACTNIIPPIAVPPDTEWVKRIKFQSKLLSEFWGQPIYLGATILLPKDYDKHPEVYYPVNYIQGHFNYGSPEGYHSKNAFYEVPYGFKNEEPGERSGYDFYKYWTSDKCPRMIAVTFQHPCPYFDDSYAVNSPNTGPYDDAIMKELISFIEENFRIIRKPYARVLSGGSTGGWISLAMQIFHPDFFGGTFSSCPDPVDFRYYQLINLYEDKNAYYKEYEWLKVKRPDNQATDGNIRYMMQDENHYELVIGDKSRGAGQWSIWEAAFSPIGEDGYPKPIWNKRTGEIDHSVAEYWKEHWDLRHYLEKNWATIGPKLVGKLHVYVGDMDDYYLQNAVILLEAFLEKTKDPYYAGTVKYGWRKPHCWGPRGEEAIQLFADYIKKTAPKGENTKKWEY